MRVRPPKSFAELHKLTLLSFPWLRRSVGLSRVLMDAAPTIKAW
jgi:hypothetical protein